MAIQEEPESPKVLLQLGYIYSVPQTRIRDLDKAQQYIDKALAIGMKCHQICCANDRPERSLSMVYAWTILYATTQLQQSI